MTRQRSGARTSNARAIFGQPGGFGDIPITSGGQEYATELDPSTRTLWGWFCPAATPCFTSRLLEDIRRVDAAIEAGAGGEIRYYVVGSRRAGVFSFGGDLELFMHLIAERDRERLADYAKLCIDNVHARLCGYRRASLTTIALVQGAALGGGFECALSSDVIVAEEGARLGFPEILFNLFPGMGAYSLLARRIGPRLAEQLVLSGKILNAHELHALGVVDVIAPNGAGEGCVREWIRRVDRRLNGTQAVLRCRQVVQPVSRTELDAVAELWVDAALRLEARDLKVMARIRRRQISQDTGDVQAEVPRHAGLDA
jgi:DSF synthase